MNAKAPPARRDEGAARQDPHQEQTRKIDSMSELAADLMLREHDGISGVQPKVHPSSPPPLASRSAFPPPSPPVVPRRRTGSVTIAVALLLALALGFALAAFLLAR
jgi:hypothetical protein